MPVKWLLESDMIFLEPAARFAGLNPNAIKQYPGPSGIGALAFPAPFCRDSIDWMRALSHLVARDREFSLFLVEIDSEQNTKEMSRTRIFPVLDSETLHFLRQINAAEAKDLHTQSQRVEDVLNRLKQQAAQALVDDIVDLYDPDQT